jgi:hypothetical protein
MVGGELLVSSPRIALGVQLRADGVLGTPRRGGDVIAELAGLPEQLIQARRKVAQAKQQAAFVTFGGHFNRTITRPTRRLLFDI